MKAKFKKGFTLIELLVVIAILGLLAGLIISNVSGVRERARDSQRKSDLYQIKTSLRMYRNDFGTYPADGASGTAFKGCGTTALPVDCDWGGEFSKNGSVYMKILPEDPVSTTESPKTYSYLYVDIDDFVLYAVLENGSDQDIVKSQENCGIASPVAKGYYVCAD